VTFPNEHVRLPVVGAERAVLRSELLDQWQQVHEVACVRGLSNQDPHSLPALFEGLLKRGRLVVGSDAGREVRIERMAANPRRVTVDVRGALER
jgi:hypothetical protein